MKFNLDRALGQLPRRLAASESAANHYDRRSIMISHDSRITTGRQCARQLRPGWSLGVLLAIGSGCARTPSVEPGQLAADVAWVQATCHPVSPDTAGWPRYQLGNITIAVPAEYRRTVRKQFSVAFGHGTASLGLVLERDARAPFGVPTSRTYEVRCNGNHSGFASTAYSQNRIGAYTAWVVWDSLNAPADRPRVRALIRASRLRDAELLRQSLHTIAVAPRGR